MTNHRDPFAASEQHAHEWLASVAGALGTDDRQRAYRALRAWLHLVRDRLGVDSAAHLGAQLPALLRGVYTEGWVPDHTPRRYTASEFVTHFAHVAGVSRDEVPATAAAVTEALRDRFSAGQLDHALSQLPRALRSVLSGEPERVARRPAAGPDSLDARVERVEAAVDRLAEAVRTLAAGLESVPVEEPTSRRTATAAHEAHRILLAGDAG